MEQRYRVLIEETIHYSRDMTAVEIAQLVDLPPGVTVEEFLADPSILGRSDLDRLEEHLQQDGDVQSSEFTFSPVQ